MSTLARALRLLIAQTARGCLAVIVFGLALPGCRSETAPHDLLVRRCMPVQGEAQLSVKFISPLAGTLRVRVEERGVSVLAGFEAVPAEVAGSPVEHAGSIGLTRTTTAGQSHSVQIRAQDSPHISGEVCVTAQVIAVSDHLFARAEQSFASAGQATQNRDWDTAFDEFRIAAADFDRLQMHGSAAAARHAMAEIAYRRFDRKRDGYALSIQALADYGRKADPVLLGLLTALEGKTLLEMPGTDSRRAVPGVRALLATARRYDLASRYGAREIPRLDIMIGFLEFRLDSPGKAHNEFSAAAQTCEVLQDWDCYAAASQNLALMAAETNNYNVALSTYADALRRLPPGLDPKLAADIRDNLGRLQAVVGLYSSGEQALATAMHEYAGLGDCPGVRRTLGRSGAVRVQIGNLGDAQYDLERAASLDCPELLATITAAPQASTSRTAATRTTAGQSSNSVLPESGRTVPCAHSLEAADLSTENKTVVFNSLLSLNDALTLESDTDAARRCLSAAGRYAVTARTRMRLKNAQGASLLEDKDAVGARSAFMDSMRIADEAKIPAMHEYRGIAQLGLAKSSLLGDDPSTAVSDGLSSLKMSVARGDIVQTVTALRVIGAGYRKSQRPAEAASTLQTATHLIEAVPIDELNGESRATYLATQYAVFAELMDLFASQALTDPQLALKAFATSERGRARSLRFAVTQEQRATGASLELPAAARYQQLLREFTEVQPGASPAGLVDSLDAAALRERGAESPLDFDQLGHILKDLDATLIEYAVGDRDMFAFVMSGRAISVVRLADRQAISSAATQLNELLRNAEAPPEDVRGAAIRLAQLVLWPLHDALAGRHVVFVPDDALHSVPFSALPWSADPADRLVVQHVEVTTVPSALFLTRIHAMNLLRTNAHRVELIGDPVFRIADWQRECMHDAAAASDMTAVGRSAAEWTERLPRLPGSRAEVQMVAQLLRQSRPQIQIHVSLGCAAVAGALRRAAADHVDLLHIATHARVDSQRPRLSALALAPESTADRSGASFGLLEILDLKLNSSLVVLSACDTSRGRLLPGEGVLGPAQAFLQAGAGAVVASFWRVDDQATSKFMQRFYYFLLLEHLPAATALRRAQLEQADHLSLHDWAAFGLYGWPDTSI
jgi:CHAT domain-containing protein